MMATALPVGAGGRGASVVGVVAGAAATLVDGVVVDGAATPGRALNCRLSSRCDRASAIPVPHSW